MVESRQSHVLKIGSWLFERKYQNRGLQFWFWYPQDFRCSLFDQSDLGFAIGFTNGHRHPETVPVLNCRNL